MVNPELERQIGDTFGQRVYSERHDGVTVESREHTARDGVVYVVQRGVRGWRAWVVKAGTCSPWRNTRGALMKWVDGRPAPLGPIGIR